MKWAIQTLWERSGKAAKTTGNTTGKERFRPNAICHVDANVLPSQITQYLDEAMKDKLYYIYTGQTPLQHPDELDIIDQMLEDAEKLYKYKPVLLAMGVETLLTKVPSLIVKELKDVLPKANCRRSAQVIYNFVNVFKVCQEGITKHQIEDVPILFDSLEVDREAIVFYNMDETEVSSLLL